MYNLMPGKMGSGIKYNENKTPRQYNMKNVCLGRRIGVFEPTT
jgi:hypothetical protein